MDNSKQIFTRSVGNLNVAIQNKVDYDDTDVAIGKELEIVSSSSRVRITDLALHEKIKNRIPKVTTAVQTGLSECVRDGERKGILKK